MINLTKVSVRNNRLFICCQLMKVHFGCWGKKSGQLGMIGKQISAGNGKLFKWSPYGGSFWALGP